MQQAQTLVKICGIRDAETALAAAEAGADLIGLNFAASKRRVAPEQAQEIIGALRDTYGVEAPLVVGLFVNETPARMREIATITQLDAIQLSGDEQPSVELLAELHLPVIRVLRVPAGSDRAEVTELGWKWHTAAVQADEQSTAVGVWGSRVLIGLDAYHPGAYGGTGQKADHALAAELAAEFPLMLAGGLSPDNVGAAIASVRPLVVDVASGVEVDGVKSHELIRQFVKAAQAAGTG